MKKYASITCILGLVCTGLILISCAATNQPGPSTVPVSTSAQSRNGGHLLVYRVANFGTNLVLILSIDGAELARLVEGQNYDGYLSPGQHVLSAQVEPNYGGISPWRKTVTIKSGQTYSFSAGWSGQSLALVRNQ
jgi:hypothetical protein